MNIDSLFEPNSAPVRPLGRQEVTTPQDQPGGVGATARSGTTPGATEQSGSSDSRLKRWSNTADHVRSIITTVVVAVGLTLVVALAVWDSLRNVVVLDSIEVPNSLAERGYTSAVATRQLADAIKAIQRESQKVELQRSGREINIGSALADVQVPGGAMSIGTMVRYVRQVLRLPESRLTGEITFDDGQLNLGTTSLRLVIRGSGEFGFSWTGSSPALSELMKSGAVEIVKNIDPYVAAVYYSTSNATLASDIILRYCLTRPPVDDDPWALVLLGNMHRSEGRLGLAIEQFKRAVESASDRRNLAEAHISWAATQNDRAHYSEALELLQEAELNNPDDIYVNIFWAQVLDSLGRPRAARERREMVVTNARKAIVSHGSSAFTYGNLAWALDGLGGSAGLDKEAQRYLQQAAEYDPATAHYYRAVLWERRADYERAVDEYRKFVQNRPQDASSYQLLALALLQRANNKMPMNYPTYGAWNSRYDEAIYNLKKAVELDGSHVLALIQLGYIYDVLEQHVRAAEQYGKALRILEDDGDDEGRALIYTTWGLAFLQLQRYGAAAEKFALAARADAKNAAAHYWWGFALENIYPSSDQKMQLAAARYQTAIELEPTFAAMHIQLGDTLVGLGRPYDATKQYRKAANIDLGADVYVKWGSALAQIPDYNGSALEHDLAGAELANAAQLHQTDPDARASFADAYTAWGDLLESRGEHSGAIEKYRHAIELNPEGSYAYKAWGRSLAAWSEKAHEKELQDAAAGIDAYAAGDGMKSRMAWTYHSWGSLLEEHKDHHGAIAKYRKTIEFDTKFSDAYSGWGIALGEVAIGSPERYEVELKHLKSALPNDPAERRAFAYVYNGVGNALERAGRYGDAALEFEKAIELDANYVDAHTGLARALYLEAISEPDAGKKTKLYDQATKAFDYALDIDPTESRTYESWGRMLYRGESYKDAATKFGKAIEFDPYNAAAYEGRGKAYVKLGKIQEAVEQYRRAIELDPGKFHGLEEEIRLLEAEAFVTSARPTP